MPQHAYEDSVRHLEALGFTKLEATVYSYLVEHSPATGYQVAHAIGKAVANTYKALQSLQEKGAVIIDETGESRACRSVPPVELLHLLRRRFETEHDAAERALSSIPSAEPAGGLFTLNSADQVYERLTLMIEKAEEIVLLDAFPAIVERIGPMLEKAAARGVVVAAQVYASKNLRKVDTIVAPSADETLRRWPGEWTCLIVDGAEYLFAYLDHGGKSVRQAIWSNSAFLSWVQHSYLGAALQAQLLEQVINESGSQTDLDAALAQSRRWMSIDARGYRDLMAHFGQSVEEPGARK